jgi:hypothetical protein
VAAGLVPVAVVTPGGGAAGAAAGGGAAPGMAPPGASSVAPCPGAAGGRRASVPERRIANIANGDCGCAVAKRSYSARAWAYAPLRSSTDASWNRTSS